MGYYLVQRLTPEQLFMVAANAAAKFNSVRQELESDIDMEIDFDEWVVRVWDERVTTTCGIDELLENI